MDLTMSSPIYGDELGLQIVEVFGIKHLFVTEINIKANPKQFAEIEIKFHPSIDNSEELIEILDKYHLIKKDETK